MACWWIPTLRSMSTAGWLISIHSVLQSKQFNDKGHHQVSTPRIKLSTTHYYWSGIQFISGICLLCINIRHPAHFLSTHSFDWPCPFLTFIICCPLPNVAKKMTSRYNKALNIDDSMSRLSSVRMCLLTMSTCLFTIESTGYEYSVHLPGTSQH